MFVALVYYAGKTIGLDGIALAKGQSPPNHEWRMTKLADKRARVGHTRPPRGGATGRYLAGVWSDALDWRTEKRQGRRQVKAVHHAGRVERRVAKAQEKVAAKADRTRTVRPFPSDGPSAEDGRPAGQIPNVRPLVRAADETDTEPAAVAQSEITIHHNDGTSSTYLTGDPEEFAAWQAEADRQANAYEIRDYEIDPAPAPAPTREPDDLATVHPIGGNMSTDTTAAPSGEILTHDTALRFAQQMIESTTKLASVGQDSMESLQSLGMSGPLMQRLAAGHEGLQVASAAYTEVLAELGKQTNAAEAVSALGDDAANDIGYYKHA